MASPTAFRRGALALPKDANNEPIQVATHAQTQDATGTPQVSPFTVSNSTVTIVVPNGAIAFIVRPTAADMLIGDNTTLDNTSPADGAGCFLIPENEKHAYPCAGAEAIYLLRAAGVDVLAYYYFEMLEG